MYGRRVRSPAVDGLAGVRLKVTSAGWMLPDPEAKIYLYALIFHIIRVSVHTHTHTDAVYMLLSAFADSCRLSESVGMNLTAGLGLEVKCFADFLSSFREM